MSPKESKERQAAYKAHQKEQGLTARRVFLTDEEVAALMAATGKKKAAPALRAALVAFPALKAGDDTANASPANLEPLRAILDAWELRLQEVAAKSKNPGDWNKIPRFQNVRRLVDELREALGDA